MDPATPLQPYTPPPQNNGGPTGGAPLTPLPSSPPSMGEPPIIQGQPYLNASSPPPAMQAPLVPMPPAPLLGQDNFGQPNPGGPNNAPPTELKSELVEHLRKANNVLVTVSNNPSVDQLSAAIGITLVLNKLDKHATAVYSGETPSVLEFLQPDKTIEKNTDSLRDFIIALDKAKADKLRYKVEDKFVKIFITPYHTSLSENDLEFSQGDFNVDVVLALGVHKREELDQAITAHGRILHDAVTVSINNKQPSDLGAINWFQAEASSLAEMLVSLVEPLQGDKAILDEQIATAFLTGVVAETERFSNNKTTPYTMNIAATLMKAGANQQLVSSKLEAPQPMPKTKDGDGPSSDAHGGAPTTKASNDGSLAIEHNKDEDNNQPSKTLQDLEKANNDAGEEDSDLAKIHIDDEGKLLPADNKTANAPANPGISSNMIMQPPTMGGPMTATTKSEEAVQPAVDTPPQEQGSLEHAKTVQPLSEEEKTQTLSEIEKSVDSDHLTQSDMPDTEAARQAVETASAAVPPANPGPIAALNAQPVDLGAPTAPTPAADLTTEDVFPPQLVGPDKGLPADPTAAPGAPGAPPPVPPPMTPSL